MTNKTSSFLTRSFYVVNGEEFEVEVEHTLGEEHKALAEGLDNYPPAGLSISVPVEIAPESEAVLQGMLADLKQQEASFRAERAGQVMRFFNDVKSKSLRNGSADYSKLRADVREFIKAVNKLGTGAGADLDQCCIYLKHAAITGLTILAEHRPNVHARFQEELLFFRHTNYAANWFKNEVWGDLFVWAKFFEMLLTHPPAWLSTEWLKDTVMRELDETEIFVNFLLLACLSRVGHGL